MAEINQENEILVTVLEKENIGKSFVGTSDLIAKSVSIPLETVAKNLRRIINNLAKVLDTIDTQGTNFQVDTVSFNLEVGASGKIALIGEVGASSNSSICIVLKKTNKCFPKT
ncbi:MAG: hypothetical protein ACFCUE_04235 [Candidatus Bathyarchaeia archaeon]|jgi:hypothetical protein